MGHQASSSCPAEGQGQDRLCSGLGSDLCKCSHEFIGLWAAQGRALGGDYEGANVRPKGSNRANVQRGSDPKQSLLLTILLPGL